MSATQRLFLALWPEAADQQCWAEIAKEWLPQGSGRLIPARNLHMTLLYLGATNSEQQTLLERHLDGLQGRSFELQLDKVGYWRKPQVAWLGCSQIPPSLLALVEQIKEIAQLLNMKTEERDYHPHITLVRKVRRPPPTIQPKPSCWQVTRFALVKSETLSSGAEYTPLRFWPLNV